MITWNDPVFDEINSLVCEWQNHTPKAALVDLATQWGVEWDGPEALMDEARVRVLGALGLDSQEILCALNLWK